MFRDISRFFGAAKKKLPPIPGLSVSGCPRSRGGGDGVGSRARVFMTTRGLARVVCLRGFNVARRCRWAVRAHRQRPKSNSEDGCDDGGSSASLQRRIFPYLTTQMPRARGVSASPKRPFAFLIHIRKPNRHPRHHLLIACTSPVPQNYLHAKHARVTSNRVTFKGELQTHARTNEHKHL